MRSLRRPNVAPLLPGRGEERPPALEPAATTEPPVLNAVPVGGDAVGGWSEDSRTTGPLTTLRASPRPRPSSERRP